MDVDNYMFFEASHSDIVLDGLNRQRLDSSLMDIRIKVADSEFPAHQCILASFSPYFKAMFHSCLAESNQEVITLQYVDAGIFSSLLDYAYTIHRHHPYRDRQRPGTALCGQSSTGPARP